MGGHMEGRTVLTIMCFYVLGMGIGAVIGLGRAGGVAMLVVAVLAFVATSFLARREDEQEEN